MEDNTQNSGTSNPYESPDSKVIDNNFTGGHSELASRWARLGAAIIDGIIMTIVMSIYWMMMLPGFWENPYQNIPFYYSLIGLVVSVSAYVLINGHFLSRSGQTVGKKLIGIQITNLQGELLTLQQLIVKRYLPVVLVSMIPLIGWILALVDVLFIFNRDKRCVHDHIAGTQVINERKG